MRRYLFLLILAAGCKQTLPPEDYHVTVVYIPPAPIKGTMVEGSFQVIEPPVEAGPPVKTWGGEEVCQQGDPLCGLMP